jgi:hypothetical protein
MLFSSGGRDSVEPQGDKPAGCLCGLRRFGRPLEAARELELAQAMWLGLLAFVGVVVWPLSAHAATFEDRTTLFTSGLGGGPSSWGDYNNDGYVDLNDGGLQRNVGGTNFTPASGFGPGIWGDYNNDGYLDIFSVASGTNVGRSLSGAGFAKVAMPPIPQNGVSSYAWVDLDADGRVDLYLTDDEFVSGLMNPGPDCMLKANPDGTFSNVWTEPLIQGISLPGKGVTACDFDEDGDQDVYVSNYRLQPNYLWRNDRNWNFTDVAVAYGVAGNGGATFWSSGHTEGSCWGDFDNDGHFDLFVGNFSHPGNEPSHFYRNLGPSGSWRFQLMASLSGADWQESYATPTLGDYDNDGYLDLFFTTTYPGDNARLYRNNGNWSFTDVTAAAGLANLPPTRQAAWADFNNDGQLDLVTGGKLFVNTGNANHWLKVRLQGNGGSVNRAAIGAQVRIGWNGQILSRQVEGGTGMNGNQNDLTLHFGLGTHGEAVNLEIVWPNGTTQTVAGVTVDRTVDVGPSPSVDNGIGATGVTHQAAVLTGRGLSIGESAATGITVYWGTSDSGTTTNWPGKAEVSGSLTGLFSVAVSGLSPNTTYYYRCRATNAYGQAWSAMERFVTAGTIPFQETFETRALGDLDFQYGWRASASSDAVVQAEVAYGGSVKACRLASTGLLWHAFSGTGAPGVTWTDLRLIPERMDVPPTERVSGQLAFCVNENGHVMLWHRDLDLGTNVWTELANTVIPTGAWMRASLRLDFGTADPGRPNQRYGQVYLEGVLQNHLAAYTVNNGTGQKGGSWFALAHTNASSMATLTLSRTAIVDDISVSADSPAGFFWTILATAGANGTISPSGAVVVPAGGATNFVLTPNRYYHVDTLRVDGMLQPVVNPYAFGPVTANHTIAADFAANLAARGTPEWWLAGFGWTNFFNEAETNDSDQDGGLTWQEYVADTIPTNGLSFLGITNLSLTPGGARIEWTGGTGAWQYLQIRQDLGNTSEMWRAIFTNPPPTSVNAAFTDPGATGAVRFYRINVERK